MASVTYPIRVDDALKRDAARVAEYYGFDLASVTRAFWKQMVRTESIPLTRRSEEPNEESLEAIRETEEIFAAHEAGERKGFDSAEAMFAAIRNDDAEA